MKGQEAAMGRPGKACKAQETAGAEVSEVQRGGEMRGWEAQPRPCGPSAGSNGARWELRVQRRATGR